MGSRQEKKTVYGTQGMVTIVLTVLILLGWVIIESRGLSVSIAGYEEKAALLREQIEQEVNRTEEIEQLRAYMKTDEFAEQVARDKLGLVKDNEIVFEEVSGG